MNIIRSNSGRRFGVLLMSGVAMAAAGSTLEFGR